MFNKNTINIERILYVIFASSIVLGLYARYVGIGLWSIGDDEFHTGQSVRYILEMGVPSFPCGGYYMRGIFYQYLLAAGINIFPGTDEVVMRAINATTNLLTLPPLLLLTHRVFQGISPKLAKMAALTVGSVFLVSVWEIEFARYIRFYAPFQAVFMWYLWYFYLYTIEKRESAYWKMLGLSFFSIFVHETGIFLIALNFLPFFFEQNKMSVRRVLSAVATLVTAYLYIKIDFRRLNLIQSHTDEMQAPIAKGLAKFIESPRILLSTFESAPLVYYIVGFVVFGLFLWSIYHILREKRLTTLTRFILLLVLICSLFNLFGIVFYLFLLMFTANWMQISNLRFHSIRFCILTVSILGVFWLIYGLGTTSWHLFFDSANFNVYKKLALVLFKYPDIYYKIMYQWYVAMPLFTSLILLVNSISWIYVIRESSNAYYPIRVLYLLTFVLIFAMAITNQPYYLSRYTFFLYPLVLLLSVASITILLNQLHFVKYKYTFIIVFLAIFAIGEDWDFSHLVNIDAKDINFRENMSTPRSAHLFYRIDMKTPAEYIEINRSKNDKVLSFVLSPYFYLSDLDYIYRSKTNKQFRELMACNGKKEIWTDAEYLYEPERLKSIMEKASSATPLWIIAHSNNFTFVSPMEKMLFSQYTKSIVYTSVDKDILVYRISQ